MTNSRDDGTPTGIGCSEIHIDCPKCGHLVARVSLNGALTIKRAEQFGKFILRVHGEAFHAEGKPPR
jgi:hypothetical protein